MKAVVSILAVVLFVLAGCDSSPGNWWPDAGGGDADTATDEPGDDTVGGDTEDTGDPTTDTDDTPTEGTEDTADTDDTPTADTGPDDSDSWPVDTDTVSPMTCTEALQCVAAGMAGGNTGALMDCYNDTAPASQGALMDLGQCMLFSGCLTGGTDIGAILSCAATNCGDELTACMDA